MKKWIKYLIALMLHYSGFNKFLLKNKAENVTLMFHRLTDDPDYMHINMPSSYYDQLVSICQKYGEIVAIDKASQQTKFSTSITFDDGFSDNLHLLNHQNVPVSLYISTAFIDNGRYFWALSLQELVFHEEITELDLSLEGLKKFTFITEQERIDVLAEISATLKRWHYDDIETLLDKLFKELSFVERNQYFLSWDEIRRLKHHGVNIGAHTHAHVIASAVSADEFLADMSKCLNILHTETGGHADSFAYPNGTKIDIPDFGDAILSQLNITNAVTTIEGFNSSHSNPLQLKRINMTRNRVESPLGKFSKAMFTTTLVRPFGLF